MIIKICPSFEGYSVSEYGDVYSHRTKRGVPGKKWGGSITVVDYSKRTILKSHLNKKNGYLQVLIRKDGKRIGQLVHRMVADAFISPISKGVLVRHMDNNPMNNHFSNLRYGSNYDNMQDRKRAGHYYSGSNHHSSKLTKDDVKEIIKLRKCKWRFKEIAKKFNVSVSCIESVIYGKAYQIEVLSITGTDAI